MKIHLLIIDPQNDFCDPKGSLFVPGADEDMKRLAAMIVRLKDKIDDIHVTLDSHRLVDIAHPAWWKDQAGNPPPPFTMITAADVKAGTWVPVHFHARTLEYLEELEKRGRFTHLVWPPHCLIGSWGHNVYPELFSALQEWEKQFATVDYVTKGSNIFTEHFSAVQAEVPDPEDHTTQLNTRLIQTMQEGDIILVAGEARSHCVNWTARDVAEQFGDAAASKLHLILDAMSDVPNPPGLTIFSDAGAALVTDLTTKGVRTTKTTDFLT